MNLPLITINRDFYNKTCFLKTLCDLEDQQLSGLQRLHLIYCLMSPTCLLMLHQSQTSRGSNQQGENIGHRSRAHNTSEVICPACVLQSCLPTFTRSSLSSAKHLSQSMRPITTGSRRLCCLLPCHLTFTLLLAVWSYSCWELPLSSKHHHSGPQTPPLRGC